MNQRHVGISFGAISHFHDGLGEFSLQFGKHIAQHAITSAESNGTRFYFHLPEKWHGLFGESVSYIALHDSQKFIHISDIRFDVWHKLHQHIRHRAPFGTAHNIVTLHDLNFLYTKTGFSRWRALQKQMRLLRRADQIVCISDYVLNDLQKHTELSCPSLRIYNGVHSLAHGPFEPICELHDLRFLLHISRMTPNKNVQCLIDLAETWPDMQFVFAGPQSGYTQGFKDQSVDRGLKNVHFLFDVSEVQKAWLYQNCLGLLFPSLTEGFGLPPIEAMHFGKPVFLSRRTCLPEIGGEVATYFDDFSETTLKRVIEDRLAHSNNCISSERICNWAKRYSWSDSIERYLMLYSGNQ